MSTNTLLHTRAIALRGSVSGGAITGAIARIAIRFVTRSVAIVVAWLALSGHVGTDIVVFEGQAGAYPVRVIIRPQGVVPAQVPIVVRVLSGTPTLVTVRAAQWNVGTKGAPPAETAAIVNGEPGTFAHDLWIMTSTAYAIHVAVEGPLGSGELVVPMQSVATRTLAMPQATGAILIVLALLLVIGLLTIVGAATREGTLRIGTAPDGARKRAARISMGVAAAVIAVALVGGAKWWQSAERSYRTGLYKPYHVVSSIASSSGNHVLNLRVDDAAWTSRRNTPLIPDHGKLMHLFLIRTNDAGVIAHLHPSRTAFDSFSSELPEIPAGQYFLFADVVHESGFQRTLVDTVNVPSASSNASVSHTNIVSKSGALPDSDDAWRAVKAVALGDAAGLANGGDMTLTADAPVTAGNDLRLMVSVRDGGGAPALLTPYMGMGGHAMIVRTDGGVFVHLHPAGTASMAAQAALVRREAGDSLPTDSASMARRSAPGGELEMPMPAMPTQHTNALPGTLAFPFAFPSAGDYRVFVQVKRNGTIETAAFKVIVP